MAEPALLLVHGSCHGAWCWRDVLPELAAMGIKAAALDLPGHGADTTPLSQVTLQAYARAILDAAARLPGPVILVGHSMAGYPITAAACAEPMQVAGLVYLCAYRPQDGMSLVDMRRAGPSQPLLPAIRQHDEGPSFSFDDAYLERLFYHDCPPGTVDFARAHLTRQAIAPQATPLSWTPQARALAQHYIICTQDRVIPPAYQAQMAQGLPPSHIRAIESSHSPFFSMPKALAAHLTEIARLHA